MSSALIAGAPRRAWLREAASCAAFLKVRRISSTRLAYLNPYQTTRTRRTRRKSLPRLMPSIVVVYGRLAGRSSGGSGGKGFTTKDTKDTTKFIFARFARGNFTRNFTLRVLRVLRGEKPSEAEAAPEQAFLDAGEEVADELAGRLGEGSAHAGQARQAEREAPLLGVDDAQPHL